MYFHFVRVTPFHLMCLCQREEMWSVCADFGEVSIWHIKDCSKPFHRITLQDCTGCYCIIKVKNQVNTHTHAHVQSNMENILIFMVDVNMIISESQKCSFFTFEHSKYNVFVLFLFVLVLL